MPFLFRATPRQDLAGRSLRSEANLAAAGHSGDTPDQTHDATKTPQRLASDSQSGQSARVKPPPWSTVLVAGSLLIGACSDVRWVTITQVSATDGESSSLFITVDACVDVPPPVVVESNTEVHVLIDLRHDYGGGQTACLGAVEVHLDTPIGTREVIDDRHRREIPVTWTPITQAVQLAGSVSELLGRDGAARVTGWLLIDQSGVAVMCDDLADNATICRSPSISIDWATGNATPPTDLVKRGANSASVEPITLTGSLKGNTLYVGVKP